MQILLLLCDLWSGRTLGLFTVFCHFYYTFMSWTHHINFLSIQLNANKAHKAQERDEYKINDFIITIHLKVDKRIKIKEKN